MSDEHTVAIVSFDGAIRREVKRIRLALQKLEDMPSFKISISVEGRVHEGDIKIKYELGWYSDMVTGDAIQPVLDEYMRRHGWQKAHDPVAITFQENSEIPF